MINKIYRRFLRRRRPIPRPVPAPGVVDPGDFGRRRDERYVWPDDHTKP